MMRLALEKVEIEVNEYDRVLVRRGPGLESIYLAGEAPKDAEKGVTPGWIAIYYLPKRYKMLIIAVRENQPMIWGPLTDVPDEEFDVLRFAITKVIATEETRRGLSRLCRELARGYPEDGYDDAMSGVAEHVSEVYARYALSFVPEDKEEQIKQMCGKVFTTCSARMVTF